MADNVYLLETRLSMPQQAALSAVRGVARQHGLTVFLVGGAVRDLISGSPVRDLDVAIQGNALDLRSALEEAGGIFSGESQELQAMYLRFPGGVRLEVGSTLSVTYPKPAQPVFQPTSILEDLRRRDFTANAMALSLNDGSYGLLMDPLNGVADIENRELRLVSNYGFIEDPVRLIRVARFMARLGWQMDERTRARYETAKEEAYIDALRPTDRAYELEELFHEEEPLRVMRRLEEEGWLKDLSPSLSIAKANTAELSRLREVQMQFQTRGVIADVAAANFALLTAKLSAKEIEAIRVAFPRAGFVEEISALDGAAKDLSAKLLSKELAAPSAAFRYLMQAPAATVVYAAYSSRSAALQNRLKSFLTEWPNAQGRVPYLLMQEMRITSELPNYEEVVEKAIYALMDGKLETPEETRAFLEPFSPPAPPPPISLRRPRAPRKEAKSKGKKKPAASAPEDSDTSKDETEAVRDAVPASPAIAVQASAEPPAEAVTPAKPPVTKKSPAKSSAPPVPASTTPAKPAAGKQVDKPDTKQARPSGSPKQPAAKSSVPAVPARKAPAPSKAQPARGKKPSAPAAKGTGTAATERSSVAVAPAAKSRSAKPGPRPPAKAVPGKQKPAAKRVEDSGKGAKAKKPAPRPPAKKAVPAKAPRKPVAKIPPAKRGAPAKPPARTGKPAPARARR